jgi:hypothetical protein
VTSGFPIADFGPPHSGVATMLSGGRTPINRECDPQSLTENCAAREVRHEEEGLMAHM